MHSFVAKMELMVEKWDSCDPFKKFVIFLDYHDLTTTKNV